MSKAAVIAESSIVLAPANILSASFFLTVTRVPRPIPPSFVALFAKALTQTWLLSQQESAIVLDVDGEIGQQTFARLELPPTATVLTSRGLHAYYRKEGPFPLPITKLSDIDVKTGGNGYILVPPSVHKQPRSAGQKHIGRQIFTRFRLNRSAGRAFAQAITIEVGGHVESLCCRGCCFRSFCRVLQPTRQLARALFGVDVDSISLRLPLSLDGSRSQPSTYEVCLGRK